LERIRRYFNHFLASLLIQLNAKTLAVRRLMESNSLAKKYHTFRGSGKFVTLYSRSLSFERFSFII